MVETVEHSKAIRRLLITFYTISVILLVYYSIGCINSFIPADARLHYASNVTALISSIVDLSLIILSIIIINIVYIKKLDKIHLIYPISYISWNILRLIESMIVYAFYFNPSEKLSNIYPYYIIFYVGSIVFISYVIKKKFPELPKNIWDKITEYFAGYSK